MAILIFDRFSIKNRPLNKWFLDCKEPMYVFTVSNHVEEYKNAGFLNVVGFENYDNDAYIELSVLELSEKVKIEKIFVCDERDIIRAANFRQYLNIDGQSYESALAYRNKVMMKTILACNGIKVPPFKKITNAKDILDFIELHAYPILIKPVDLYASINIEKINCYDDLKSFCNRIGLKNMMVERFVDAKMVSCNGLVINNKIEFISTTIYFEPRLQYQDYMITITIPSNDSFTDLVEAYCRDVIQTLPHLETSVFHSEIFVENSECSLCEIASRPAGGGISDSIRHSYGIDFYEELAKATYNADYKLPKYHFKQLSGCLTIPKKKGTVQQMIDRLPYSWVVEYYSQVKKGDIIDNSQENGDRLALVIIVGEDMEQLLLRFDIIKKFFEENMLID